MVGKFPEVSNFNRLFLELNRFIWNFPSSSVEPSKTKTRATNRKLSDLFCWPPTKAGHPCSKPRRVGAGAGARPENVCGWCTAVFKIEVFNALQARFGPSKYTPLKNNPSKRNPKLKTKTSSLEVLYVICPSQEPTSVGHCHYKK